MFNARDCAYANYLMEALRRDIARHTPGTPIGWSWTVVLLWMSEEVEAESKTLQTPEATRRDMVDLAMEARRLVREARRSMRLAA